MEGVFYTDQCLLQNLQLIFVDFGVIDLQIIRDVKGKIVSFAKLIVFGTNGKIILFWSMFAIEPIAHFSLLPDN